MFSKLGLFASNRVAQQGARYYGRRVSNDVSNEAFNESVAHFKELLMQRYKGINTIIERDGQHWVQTHAVSLNLDVAAEQKALAALPKNPQPLPYDSKRVKGEIIDTPEGISDLIDEMMKHSSGPGY